MALDYTQPGLRAAMADVFLFWCRQGCDGFRCDAGYMIPTRTWRYIVARVRQALPNALPAGGVAARRGTRTPDEANLDWAYSEIFQEEDRRALERYLPDAIARSQTIGPLIHFAETHDNNRLAARGPVHARMRTALAALLSQSGAFGITNGVEWLATEKINVHGATDLRWNAPDNQVEAIARLNRLLARHPAFGFGATVELVQRGGGNVGGGAPYAPQGQTLLVSPISMPHAIRRMAHRGLHTRHRLASAHGQNGHHPAPAARHARPAAGRGVLPHHLPCRSRPAVSTGRRRARNRAPPA